MTSVRNLLLAGAALSLFAIPVAAAPNEPRPILLAQAEGEAPVEGEVVKNPVTLAEEAVEEARAALRAAMATGRGIAEARQKLRDALKVLEDARAAAGLPPAEQPEQVTEPPAPPAAEETPPPAVEEPPPIVEEPPPVVEEPPPIVEEPPPIVEEPPPVVEEPPPVAEEPPPVVEEPPPPPPEEPPPPVVEELPPPVTEPPPPPVVEETPTPPVQETAPPVVEEEVEPPPPVVEELPPPVVEETPTPPVQETAPPVVEEQVAPPAQPPATEPPPVVESVAPPVVVLPPPVILEPPPPPPPAALQGPFDLQKFSQRPKFGQEPPTAPPEPPLPQTPEAVKEGAALAAPDGRVIVKNQGQVTVVHDDTGRFRQQGDQVRTEQTANQTQTTTVVRPDGTEIVTIRDRWGNIVQRYRRNRNGSVEILIGEMEQPGFVGRIFGRGAQPAPPPPLRPPAPINLQFGPLVLSIPQQQYIVESSRANQQQLEQALFAPPVEAVERPYTLEEIRRSGRLRDKVRRIDFDTITFDTGKATVPDDQIARMQSIGLALRDAIQQDPTQVFLIEGHTDAVGSDLYNLALSDRRAETVAEILSYYFGVPPENMVSQGYGEQYLKIPTVAAERQNRRVAFRNITYLLRAGQ